MPSPVMSLTVIGTTMVAGAELDNVGAVICTGDVTAYSGWACPGVTTELAKIAGTSKHLCKPTLNAWCTICSNVEKIDPNI